MFRKMTSVYLESYLSFEVDSTGIPQTRFLCENYVFLSFLPKRLSFFFEHVINRRGRLSCSPFPLSRGVRVNIPFLSKLCRCIPRF